MDHRMGYEQFLTLIEQNLGVRRERAERAIQATVQTLAERIASGEARDQAEEMSDQLAPWVATPTDAERFDVDEFVRRMADREGVDVPTADATPTRCSGCWGRRSAGASSTTWPRSCRGTTAPGCKRDRGRRRSRRAAS